jgi:SAM-dependent methyltransferase
MANNDLYWHRKAVGGLWEQLGRLQFDFMVARGLKREHYFLDIGCGSLRGGVHFIHYLAPGHYCGMDASKEILDAGLFELRENELLDKQPVLINNADFEFQLFNQTFDYAIAQSVFTHLPLNSIVRCLMNVEKVLSEAGLFFTTFFESKKEKFYLEPILHPQTDGPGITSFFDKNPYHYNFQTFEWICENSGLKVEYIGGWQHPRDQQIMVFTKK